MVLADAEDVEPDGVGQLDLLEQVVHPLCRRDRLPGDGIRRQLAEGVDTQLHYLRTQLYRPGGSATAVPGTDMAASATAVPGTGKPRRDTSGWDGRWGGRCPSLHACV